MKSGFVSLVGIPNVGKSTLLNALLGEKIAITTSKPQTTRDNIKGILTKDDYQIVIVDTPGIHDSLKPLNIILTKRALEALKDVNAIIHLVDGPLYAKRKKIHTVDKQISGIIKQSGLPAILCITKTDKMKNKTFILELISYFKELHNYSAFFPISATKNQGVSELLGHLLTLMPAGEVMFDGETLSDKDIRFHVSEIIREKLFKMLRQELPYSTAVVIEDYKEEKGIDKIYATIFVEHKSQKAIVIGKNGETLKRVGSMAREDVESLVGKKVYLNLYVKVFDNWTHDERKLSQLGFS